MYSPFPNGFGNAYQQQSGIFGTSSASSMSSTVSTPVKTTGANMGNGQAKDADDQTGSQLPLPPALPTATNNQQQPRQPQQNGHQPILQPQSSGLQPQRQQQAPGLGYGYANGLQNGQGAQSPY